jgi:hypothetical protein
MKHLGKCSPKGLGVCVCVCVYIYIYIQYYFIVDRHVARMGEKKSAYKILVGKPEGNRPFGRPRHT